MIYNISTFFKKKLIHKKRTKIGFLVLLIINYLAFAAAKARFFIIKFDIKFIKLFKKNILIRIMKL